jgi:hypothetical protein
LEVRPVNINNLPVIHTSVLKFDIQDNDGEDELGTVTSRRVSIVRQGKSQKISLGKAKEEVLMQLKKKIG